MSFESEYHATKLRELRSSNANDEAFLGGLKAELESIFSLIFLPTCRSVIARVNAAGRRMELDETHTNRGPFCVCYRCASPEPELMRALVFEMIISVVTVEDGAVPLPTTPDADDHIEFEHVTPEILAHLLGTGEKVRDVQRRMERAAEYHWILNIQPTWDNLVHRMQSIGYDFQSCFLDECALDIRDSELRIHIGLSAIVAAIMATE